MDLFALTRKLIKIPSVTGDEKAVGEFLSTYLDSLGYRVQRQQVEKDRFNIIATTDASPRVVLSTHMDTVPPHIAYSENEELIFGRGACDAKGIAASMILAAETLRERGTSVALLFVVGEETTHDGARAANLWAAANLRSRPRVLINGEPTESTLALGTKGAMRVIVRTTGRAAHSAYPELGDSAISRLVGMLAELEGIVMPDDAVLGPTTLNIGAISGGVADNVIAPAAEARLMARLVTPAEEVFVLLERWASGRALLEQGVTVPPVRLQAIDGFPTSVAAFATDLPSLTNWGTPYLFGPGSVHVAHTDNEHVSVAELESAVDAYVRLATAAIARLHA